MRRTNLYNRLIFEIVLENENTINIDSTEPSTEPLLSQKHHVSHLAELEATRRFKNYMACLID